MQQQIRFCSTADGVRIAYATVGAGPALIFAQPISHLGVEWEEPRVRDFWETIGPHHMVIRTTSTAVGSEGFRDAEEREIDSMRG
jgi:hypothetical protein